MPGWGVTIVPPQLPKGNVELIQGDSFAILRGGGDWELGLSYDEHWTRFFFVLLRKPSFPEITLRLKVC